MSGFNHIIIKDHRPACPRHPDNGKHWWSEMGSTDNYLFYANKTFFLLTQCGCIAQIETDCDYMLSVLKQMIPKIKKIENYKIEKSYQVEKKLMRLIRDGNIHTAWIHEVNYLYSSASLDFAIVSKLKYIDYIQGDLSELELNYNKAKKYLSENEYDELIPQLNDLYEFNKPEVSDDILMYRTINEFTKELRKQIRKQSKNKKL